MNHPYIANANANERFNQMIQAAETHRLRERVSPLKVRRDLLSGLKERFPVFKGQRLDESANSPA